MENLILVMPEEKHMQMVIAYKDEFYESGERIINGDSYLTKYLDADDYMGWLKYLENSRHAETVSDKMVPASEFLLMRKNGDKVLGTINIRHELNDFLKKFGGHIGYSIAPSERRKGYGTKQLALALEYCKNELELDKVMLTCNKDNIGSVKTIVNMGGKKEKEIIYDGKILEHYWIDL